MDWETRLELQTGLEWTGSGLWTLDWGGRGLDWEEPPQNMFNLFLKFTKRNKE